jgi:hypothetical protein
MSCDSLLVNRTIEAANFIDVIRFTLRKEISYEID